MDWHPVPSRSHETPSYRSHLIAACANEGGSPSDHEPAADFRDGSYFYVLGYSGPDGEQIRGGSHVVVGFDEAGKTEAIDDANRVSRLHPDITRDSEYHLYDGALTEGQTDWDVFASTWWPQSDNGTAWRWQPGSNQDYNNRSDINRLSPMEKYEIRPTEGAESWLACGRAIVGSGEIRSRVLCYQP